MGLAVAVFGLSLSEAWAMTVPDFAAVLKAYKRVNAPPDTPKRPPGERLTESDASRLRAWMRDVEATEDAQQWRSASRI